MRPRSERKTRRRVQDLEGKIAVAEVASSKLKCKRRALVGAIRSAHARSDPERDAQIIEEYVTAVPQYGRLKRIAAKYHLTTRQIQRIVKKCAPQRRPTQTEPNSKLPKALSGDPTAVLNGGAHPPARRITTIAVPRKEVRYWISQLRAVEKLMGDQLRKRTEVAFNWPENVLARFSHALSEMEKIVLARQ
jgi:hypothetical protein